MIIIFSYKNTKIEDIKCKVNTNSDEFNKALYNIVKTQIKASIKILLHSVDIIDTISFGNMLKERTKDLYGYEFYNEAMLEVLQEMEDNEELIYINTSNKNTYVYLPIDEVEYNTNNSKNKVCINIETWDNEGIYRKKAEYIINCHDGYVKNMDSFNIPYLLNRMLKDLCKCENNRYDDKNGTTLELNI